MQSFFSYKVKINLELQPHDIPELDRVTGGDTRIDVVPGDDPLSEVFTEDAILATKHEGFTELHLRVSTRKAPAKVVAKAFDAAAQVRLKEMREFDPETAMTLEKFKRTKRGKELKNDIKSELDDQAEVTYDIVRVILAHDPSDDLRGTLFLLTHKAGLADDLIAYLVQVDPDHECEFATTRVDAEKASNIFKALILNVIDCGEDYKAIGPMAWKDFKATCLEAPYRPETTAALSEHTELTLCGYTAVSNHAGIKCQYSMNTTAQGVDLGKEELPVQVDRLIDATKAFQKLIDAALAPTLELDARVEEAENRLK